jgi:hypothetical protein
MPNRFITTDLVFLTSVGGFFCYNLATLVKTELICFTISIWWGSFNIIFYVVSYVPSWTNTFTDLRTVNRVTIGARLFFVSCLLRLTGVAVGRLQQFVYEENTGEHALLDRGGFKRVPRIVRR